MISCFAKLQQDDIQLKHSQMEQLFDAIDLNRRYVPFKNNFFKRFENKDFDIEESQKILVKVFEDVEHLQDSDPEENLNLLDDLDLFAYSDIVINTKKTNALLEALA
jgi:hypothetical protein